MNSWTQEKSELTETEPSGYIDYETTVQTSMETHLPESNIGYKLLQKMGWTAGKGLGPNGQGRVDPIRIELKDDALGVGKAQELNTNHIESTSKRKALDSEKQLEESDIQRIEREYRAEKKLAIEKELQQVKRVFYCELCDKQYKKISEYDQHLQSYDHHHKKRFKDMKETTRNSTINQSEREKKLARERKREEKELKRMQEAMQKKMGGTDQQPKKPILAVSSTVTGSGGGWANTETSNSGGGWTNTGTRSSGGGWVNNGCTPSADIPPSTTQVPQVHQAPQVLQVPQVSQVQQAPQVPSAPKKLAFGLKKSGFQFGLKKK